MKAYERFNAWLEKGDKRGPEYYLKYNYKIVLSGVVLLCAAMLIAAFIGWIIEWFVK